MKLLYGTENPAKLEAMRLKLAPRGIELIGLNDLEGVLPKIEENGTSPLENARKKALAYWSAFHIPVFSCDSGLYFENVPDEIQPGVHVRTVNGQYLSDEEMLTHYSALPGSTVRSRRNTATPFALCWTIPISMRLWSRPWRVSHS